MNSNSSETIEQFPLSMDLVSTPVLEGAAPLTSVVSSMDLVSTPVLEGAAPLTSVVSSMDLVSTPVLEGAAPLTSVVSSVEEEVPFGEDSKSSAASTGPVEEQVAEQSKRQLKKLKKREAWMSKKAERRNFEKEKRKQKRREKLERGEELGPSKKRLKLNTMKNSKCLVKVAIDCSFDDLMAEKDINKFGQQIQYCYSKNRRAEQPMQLFLTSLGSKTKERLNRIGDYHGWDINLHQESYQDVFDKDSIVYLTSDSPNVLESMTPDKAYIIGGLVDHNHHKGLCHDLATKKGISHARLPINEFMQLSSRNVLTVNHVFEILLRFTESNSWKEAFFSVIPKRKQADFCRAKKNKLDSTLDSERNGMESSSSSDSDCFNTESELTVGNTDPVEIN